MKMTRRNGVVVLALLLCLIAATVGTTTGDDWFLLQDQKQVIQTEAGEMRVAMSNFGGGGGGRAAIAKPLHIGFLTMEPKSLMIPQYLDSGVLMFVRRGEVKLGLIYEDELAERGMKTGDVYWIPPGSVFYLVNTGEGQRLQVVCAIDPSESLGSSTFQSFFIGGGTYPTSILAGFDPDTLATAFNVTISELREMMSAQRDGPIVFLDDASLSPQPRTRTSVWSEFLRLKPHDRLRHLRQMFDFTTEESSSSSSSWKETLYSFRRWGTSTSTGKSPDSYNLYSKKADFSNSYGWSKALDEAEYSPLKQSGIGVFLVNLTAGSMMAPHVNPTATEYGVVLRGEGSVEIVYPNGTQAIKTEVAEGDVFLAPRYFPFSQMASRTGPMEFFGFTTSARKNRPLFLVGRGSVVESMKGAELAAGFGMAGDEKRFRGIAEAQRESVILPSASASPPYVATE